MAMSATATKGKLPNPVAVFNPVDQPCLGKGIQSPIDGDPIKSDAT